MPNIPTYTAKDTTLRPSELGVDAVAGAARRIGGFFNQAASAQDTLARETERLAGQTQQLGRETSELGAREGSELTDVGRRGGSAITAAGDMAVKEIDRAQISKGANDFTALMLAKTQQWNDIAKNADPNDPTAGPKFLQGLNTDLDSFKSGFSTEEAQKWAEAHVDALRQHLAEKTVGDMASMAGTAAVVNHQQTINQLSATVHGDPGSIDFALATLKSSTEGVIASSPNITGAKANEVRSELLQKGSENIVKAAAIGYIDKTGKMPDWVTDPKYSKYVNGAELQIFENAAKAQAKTNTLSDKQAAIAQRQINEGKAHDAANQLITDHVKLDPVSGRPIIGPDFFKGALEIAKMPNAAPGLARTLFDWGEHQQSAEAKATADDPKTKQALMDNMFSPDKPTTRIDILRAQADGKLGDHTATMYEKMVSDLEKTPLKGEVWKSTISAVKGQLIRTDMLDGVDAVGTTNYAGFMADFIPKYLAKSRDGTLPANALNLRDPSSMISQTLEPYKRSMQSNLHSGSGFPAEKDITGVQPAPVATSAPRPPPAKPPEKGFVKDGYEFQGGNPGDVRSWKKIEERS